MKEEVEVVISGVSGAFPECKNVAEFEEALFKKTNLVTDDKRKWKEDYNFPTHCGKAHNHDKFDALFFNVTPTLSASMDLMIKRCLETSVEAVIDAGVSPGVLKGSRTAVYSCYDASEGEIGAFYSMNRNFLLGTARCFSANRVSFAFDLTGPSYMTQGGRGMLFRAFKQAKLDMQEGRIDAAIISVGNVILSKRYLEILDGMGFSARDGKCCPFDEQAHGYNLSEGWVAFFLQKASVAKRCYATVIGSDQKFLGTKCGGLCAFDGKPAKQMLRELYSEWKVDPGQVTYVEAEGCGVKELDLKEIDVVADVFCRDRKEPLLIGSVKSNAGHADTAACAFGTVKALFALTNSKIPATINTTSPLPQLESKGIQVVSETTSLPGDLVAVNSVGFAGQFGHLLLKKRPQRGSSTKISETLPQILMMSSRTEKGIAEIMEHTKSMNITPEYADLVNGVFRDLKHHNLRGYMILSANGFRTPLKSKRVDGAERPMWWVFSGMGSQWNQMGSQLMHIPIFRGVIDRCDRVLRPHGVDIKHIITTDDTSILDNILNCFVGITAVQIGLVEILRALEFEPDRVIGHSLGELACAYADNCLTLEQTILASHARGRASIEAKLVKGMMAAIGMSHSEIINQLPETIDVACHNSDTSCTISGPTEDVEKFVAELKSKGIFAKSVNVSNIAYHSRYIQPAAPILMKYLREVIPEKTKRSEKWITTSVSKENLSSDLAAYSSAEYHTNNLLSPVFFEDVLRSVPAQAVVIEIAPHGLLQAILKRAFPDSISNVSLTNRSNPDGVKFLLDAIGELYLLGYKPKVSALYPPVQYPVPPETPSLQPLVTWDHAESYAPPKVLDMNILSHCEQVITLKEMKKILDEYDAQGFSISSLAFFLVQVWKIVERTHIWGSAGHNSGDNKKTHDFNKTPVIFKEIRVCSELDLFTEDLSHVYLAVLRGSGDFIVNQVMKAHENATEISRTLLRGRCAVWEEPKSDPNFKTVLEEFQSEKNTQEASAVIPGVDSDCSLDARLSEIQVCTKGACGSIEWTQDWVVNLNTIVNLHLYLNIRKAGGPMEVTSIQSIYLLPENIKSGLEGSNIKFYADSSNARFDCDGVIMDDVKTKPRSVDCDLIENLNFVPYGATSFATEYEFVRACFEVILENSTRTNLEEKKITIFRQTNESIVNQVVSWLKDAGISFSSKQQQIQVEESTFSDGPKSWNRKIDVDSSDGHVSILWNAGDSQLQLPCFSNADNMYLIVISPHKTRSVIGVGYASIYEQIIGTYRFTLFKKVENVLQPRSFKVDKNWRLSVENLEKDGTQPRETVLLFIDDPTLATPLFPVRDILNELVEYNARCYIILDKNVPSYEPPTMRSHRIYEPQIQRDVVVNVLLDGRWGRYQKQEIPKAVLTCVLPTMKEPERNHSEEVDIKYLGLNEIDYDGCGGGITLMDYSGVTTSGQRVMGLASRKDKVGEKVVLDPIFRWELPPGISLEVAATLPYAYLMGNLVIRGCDVLDRCAKQVMVHSGQTPVGMMCIALALHEGHSVFSTVPNDAAKEVILKNFPQIPASRITNHTVTNFFVPLMMETKGRGADLIISDLPEAGMINSWGCIAELGAFMNLNGSAPARNVKLPMFHFNGITSFRSFAPRDIAAFSPERKRRLHGLVEEWIHILAAQEPSVNIPYRIFAPHEINRTTPACLKPGEKLLLNLQDCKNTIRSITERDGTKAKHTDCPHANPCVYFILCPSSANAIPLMKKLVQRGIKKFVVATLNSPPNADATSVLQAYANKYDASVSVMSGISASSQKDAETLISQVLKLGQIEAVFIVSLEQNTGFVTDVKEIVISTIPQVPIINIHDKKCAMVEGVISVIRDGNVDHTEVLDHALLNKNREAVYLVSKRTNNVQKTSGSNDTNQIKDFLPSSMAEIEEIGRFLTAGDIKCDSQSCAKFISIPSSAGRALRADTRPVFIISAFCGSHMQFLVSRLMYPCFIAHTRLVAKSIDQVASDLLRSMLRIQKRGPFTIVAETWSGGLAMTLSRLLASAGHDATLFLLQGFPDKMKNLLPPKESLSKLLINTLFPKSRAGHEIQNLKQAISQLPDGHDKALIERAAEAILQSLEFLRCYDSGEKLQHELVAIEVGRLSRLTANDINQKTDKKAQLIKSDRKTLKELLIDPVVPATINAEAPFSWNTY
nr:PREDICTED: fatty acid synthase-like [Bemisia tabaci]